MSGQADPRKRGRPLGFKTRFAWWVMLAVAVGLAMSLPLWGVQAGGYAPPNPHGFTRYQSYDADGDGDGTKETRIVRYLSPGGDSLFSMTTGERLWAWSLATHAAEPGDLERNYVIRDSDCDGAFDERYALDDEYHVPECAKASPAQ